MAIHDFYKELKETQKDKYHMFWGAIYRQAFPLLVGSLYTGSAYNNAQMRGVDRVLFLSNDTVIRVEEKQRYSEFGDIAFEVKHTKEKDINSISMAQLGWINKQLAIDFLAYAFMPSNTAHLFSWHILQLAFNKNKAIWYEKTQSDSSYKMIVSENKNYWSHNLCVPIPVVYKAMNECFVFDSIVF